MTWRVVFEPAAQADVMDAAAWYDRRVPDLGDAFVAEVDAAMERIAAQPTLYPAVHKAVRRVRLRRFPYSLFYVMRRDMVRVLACFHGNRDPRHWQERG